jgi:hypothetical protein
MHMRNGHAPYGAVQGDESVGRIKPAGLAAELHDLNAVQRLIGRIVAEDNCGSRLLNFPVHGRVERDPLNLARRGNGRSITARSGCQVPDQRCGPSLGLMFASFIGRHGGIAGNEVACRDMRPGEIIQKPADTPMPMRAWRPAFIDIGIDGIGEIPLHRNTYTIRIAMQTTA